MVRDSGLRMSRMIDSAIELLEREIKYLVPSGRSSSLRAWLQRVCTPDPTHPPALVCTTYYDTPALSLLGEKIDSDYLKTKVRVRWYASLEGDASDSPVFAEVKDRVGAGRQKLRVKLDVDPDQLSRTPLHAPAWLRLLDPLRDQVPTIASRVEPVLSISYARYRYADALSSARLTIDENIVVTAVNRIRLVGRVLARLPIAVLEYKGAHDNLPAHLAAATRFDARRGSCSKYLACYQLATGLLL
jgi:hypothetical protein